MKRKAALIAMLVAILLWFFFSGCGDTIFNVNQEQNVRLGDLPCCPEETQQGETPSSATCIVDEPNRSSFRLLWTGGSAPWRVTTMQEETGALEQFFEAANGMTINPVAGGGTFTVSVNGQTCQAALDK